MKEELSLHLPDGSIWFDQHFAAETGVHIFLISPQCVSLSWSRCIHSAHWQAHEMWEFWAASLGLRSLLCIMLMFSDFEGKAFSYSQIMVHCSIMQVASYKCFPFTRGQAQQPETFGCACGFARSENSECLLARCDLLIWVRLQFVLYPHMSWCSFPQMICNWISPKSQPGEGKAEMGRWDGSTGCVQARVQTKDRGWWGRKRNSWRILYFNTAKRYFQRMKILENSKKSYMQKQVVIFFLKNPQICRRHINDITSSSKARCNLTSKHWQNTQCSCRWKIVDTFSLSCLF